MLLKRNTEEQRQEEERRFVQETLIRRFRGDQTLLYRDLPEFLEHPELKELLLRYAELQDAIHVKFLEAGYGVAELDITIEEPESGGKDSEPVVNEGDATEHEPEVTETPVDESVAEAPESPDTDAPEEGSAELPEDASLEKAEEEDPTTGSDNPQPDQVNPTADAEETEGEPPLPESPATDEPTDPDPQPMKESPIIPVRLNLPNAKTGLEFVQKVDLSPLQRDIATLESWETSGFEDLGLDVVLNEVGFTLQGVPTEHGKFPVTILVRFGDQDGRPGQSYRLQAELDILPDPRKMWKELEPDSSLPYQKAHFHSDQIVLGGHTMIAASRRGRSHAHNGTFRDDEFDLTVSESTGWYIMAVADGAGSAPYSRRGSQIAVEKCLQTLQQKIDEKFTQDIEALAIAWKTNPTEQLAQQIRSRLYEPLSHSAYAGYRAIGAEAEQLGEQPKAFHTTLIATIVRQFDCGYFVGTWWVGDGAAGILRKGQYLKVLGNPDGGEYAGQTRFLTMPEIWADGATVMKRIDFDVVPDFTAVMIMTDGVSDPKFHTDYNLNQVSKWDELWNDLGETVIFDQSNLDAHEQLLEWLDFWASGEHDDRTIAILF